MALALLRLIGEEVRKERTTRVVAQLPVDVATYLINEKREWLHQVEAQRETDIVLVPDVNMQTPNYSIRRVRDDEMGLAGNAMTSYQMAGQTTVELDFQSPAEKRPAGQPAAVQQIAPAAPAPTPVAPPPVAAPRGPSLWSRLMRFLQGSDQPARARAESEADRPRREERPGNRPPRDHREDRGGRRPHRNERGPRRDRDRNRDRDGNRGHDRDRQRDQERQRPDDRAARGNEPRDGGGRHRERPPESFTAAPRPPQVAGPGSEQSGGEGESQRRRRRRRGRGGRGGRDNRPEAQGALDAQHASQGNGDTRSSEMSAPRDSMPPAMAAPTPPPRQEPFQAMAPVASPAPPPPPPVEAPASTAPKTGSTYTVWSSTPGEGHHFEPKE